MTHRESPASDQSGKDNEYLNIRDKTLLKRNISKHHNNNFSAGFVPIHEEALHKTGLRGRKTYLFWGLVALLCILALGNMILTLTILKVLRLGQGMESLELIPEKKLIKFYGNTDLDKVYKWNGMLEGFRGTPIEISGDSGNVNFNIQNAVSPPMRLLKMERNGTHIQRIGSFDIKDPDTGHTVFSTVLPQFSLHRGVSNIDVKEAKTHRVTSAVDEKLVLRSDSVTRLRGSEGTRMEGREIIWSADQFIFLRSINGSIRLSGDKGVALDVKKMLIAREGSSTGVTLNAQYKVCICMPQGKLFRVPVTAGRSSQAACHNIDLSPAANPCM